MKEKAWDLSLANVACDTTLDASDGHSVSQVVELLEQLVAEDDVKDATDKLNQG